MSMGLLVKDTSGNITLGPSTFTVRLVEARAVRAGRMAPGQVLDIGFTGQVRGGMFAQLSPLAVHEVSYNLQRAYVPGMKGGAGRYLFPTNASDNLPCLPSAQVHNGFVRLRAAPNFNGNVVADVVIYVLTHI